MQQHRDPLFELDEFDDLDEVQRSFAAGMEGHLTKPLDPKAILATVARYAPGVAAEA